MQILTQQDQLDCITTKTIKLVTSVDAEWCFFLYQRSLTKYRQSSYKEHINQTTNQKFHLSLFGKLLRTLTLISHS